jgi:hypothetical protein
LDDDLAKEEMWFPVGEPDPGDDLARAGLGLRGKLTGDSKHSNILVHAVRNPIEDRQLRLITGQPINTRFGILPLFRIAVDDAQRF